MAVYTQVDEDELEQFLAGYDLGSVMSFKGIAEGVENTNYLLHTERGYFILTLYEKRVAAADLPFFVALMEHLAARGINCPQPVKNRKGAALGELAGRPAMIVTYLEGVWLRRPHVQHCMALGRAMAELHEAGANFKLTRENALGLAGWKKLAPVAEPRADEVAPGLAQLIHDELGYLEKNWPRALPAGVIHADLFPDNVFFLGEKLSGLIDFYFACNDLLVYDIAISLNSWCFEIDGSFNVTKSQALFSGYNSVRKLERGEVESLPLLARGASLRILLTRTIDWLNVPPGALVRPKDPQEYLKKLRFHRRIDHARDYGLAA
ncbi:MAG TPA: homoserine kinase [Xanthobacteraceae bacterium]|nr:homoserine kinase [Xanthobacteraceae bacterium]